MYRAHALDALTDADVEVRAERGIRLICDLGNDLEVTNAPAGSPLNPEPRQLQFPIGGDTGETASILERIVAGKVREFVTDAMTALYLGVLDAAAATFAEIVRLASEPANHPMVAPFGVTLPEATGAASAASSRTASSA